MDDLLREVGTLVGVEGCFLCDAEGALLARHGLESVGDDQLATVGRVLTQSLAALSLARRRKVGDIELVYENGRLVGKGVGEGCLVIRGAANLNLPLVNLTANLVVRKLKERTRGQAAAQAAPPDPAQAVRAMAEFLERLAVAFGDQGFGRDKLLAVAKHRLKGLEKSFPFMKAARVSADRIDLSGLPVETTDAEDLGRAIAALVHGLGVSARGVLGEEPAAAKYQLAYQDFYPGHVGAFEALGIGDSLRGVMSQEAPAGVAGVDLRLD